jgi:membrane fusion protein (multidrug efflux system)
MNDISPGTEDRSALRSVPPEVPARRHGVRPLVLSLLVIAVLAAAGWYGWHWWRIGRFLEETDDAYLQTDNVAIAPKIGGLLIEVPVENNQKVTAGMVIARIDARDYRVAVDLAQANLQEAQADAKNLDAQLAWQQSLVDQAGADIGANDAAVGFSKQEQDRYKSLVANGAATVQRVQQAESELKQRNANLLRARATLDAAKKQLDIIRAQQDKAIAAAAAARARLAQAELDLSHTEITAPEAGVVGDLTARIGQFVQPGTRLLTIVPVQDIYLIANFKETQLQRIVPGERVAIDIDTFPGFEIAGSVASLSPGSGSQFSLLPPENATGNFTKIVQRVPVTIHLDRDNPLAGRLRPGLSVTATIDTRTAPASAKRP